MYRLCPCLLNPYP
uniref:Uncharacterized protein n=1 Tax=Anguilla anguilla TaxID=7936 RepID=A0A0E9UNP3_ANGAN